MAGISLYIVEEASSLYLEAITPLNRVDEVRIMPKSVRQVLQIITEQWYNKHVLRMLSLIGKPLRCHFLSAVDEDNWVGRPNAVPTAEKL